jgi:hypothetical protein
VAGERIKLHNEELRNLYASPNIIRRIRWVGHVACMGNMENAYSILVGKPEGKRPLGTPMCRWGDHFLLCFILDL